MEKMTSFTISGLPKIYFGSGQFQNLIPIIKSFGKNVLLITGKDSFLSSARGSSFLDSVTQSKLKVHKATIGGEPSSQVINDIVKEFRKHPINIVVSIGGGSVIDAGKAISAMLAEEGSVEDYLEGIGTRKPSGIKAPFIAIPTTAGTGSETTKNAVISEIGINGYKKSLRHDNYMPDIALVDPELSETCPFHITASCGLDAISQLFESYTSTNGNPFTDSLALSGLRSACDCFDNLFESETPDIRFREMMSYAAMISGITLSQAGLGTIHGIAGPVGGFINIPHGVVCGLLLPVITERIVTTSIETGNIPLLKKIATVGKELTADQSREDSYYCKLVSDTFTRWSDKAGLPRLGTFGFTDEHLAHVVNVSDNKSSPVSFSKSEITDILNSIRTV